MKKRRKERPHRKKRGKKKESVSQILDRMGKEIDEYMGMPEILDYEREEEPQEKLVKEVEDLRNSSVLLVLNPAEQAFNNNTEMVKALCRNRFGLYVTVSYPYSVISKNLREKGVNTELLFFIDAITKTISGKPEKTRNCLYMASPSSLTEMGIAISHALDALPRSDKFVFLDSLSTMLIYNEPPTVARFSHFIINKVKLQGFKGVLSSVEGETNKNLLKQLIPLCDKTIRV